MAELPPFPTVALPTPQLAQATLAFESPIEQEQSPMHHSAPRAIAPALAAPQDSSPEINIVQVHHHHLPAAAQTNTIIAANEPHHNLPLSASPLNRIPTDISLHRGLLFALDTPVQLTRPVWERFWPYVDNIWCMHQKPSPNPSTGVSKIYGGCRLNRKTNFPPPVIHENSRPRQRREGGTCKAKFRLTIFPDGKRILERTGEPHSHDLEHIDGIKRNSGVRGLVLDDFFKSWEAGGILAYLRDTAVQPGTGQDGLGKDLLKEAGGLYLSRQEVQNILNGALKKAYPGQDVSEVKKQMDKYKTMTTCNFRGCAAPAFPDIKALMDHRKAVHGLKSHDHSDKLYACPDKSCWRRKKSKGFSTLLGLEEHMREKHGNGSIDALDGLGAMEPQLGDADDTMDLEMNLTMDPLITSNQSGLAQMGLPDTPDSSGEEVHNSSTQEFQDQNTDVDGNQEMTRVLTTMEREKMVLRLKRLQIERQKLDREIEKLNRALYPENDAGAGQRLGDENDVG